MRLLVFKKKLRIIDEPNVVFEQKYAVNFDDDSIYSVLGIDDCILEDKLLDERRGYETLSVEYKVVDISDDGFVEAEI